MDMHKRRLRDMKAMTDSSKPETFDLMETMSKNQKEGKKKWLKDQRDAEIDNENLILFEKIRKIKEQNTRDYFRYLMNWLICFVYQFGSILSYPPATDLPRTHSPCTFVPLSARAKP